MHVVESKYVDKQGYLSRYAHAGMVSAREARMKEQHEFGEHEGKELAKFIPFLMKKCGLEFHGRVLEIGAGGAWLSAEISKLPRVVEVIATDYSPKILKEQAPRVFKMLKASTAKITRVPGDFHQFDFPANYFDFVVSSAALNHATNMVQAVREVKRVLKPGGTYVAIREPVWPLMKGSSKRQGIGPGGLDVNHHTLRHYKETFKQAALPLDVKRVNLSGGFKYFLNGMVNGITHARYAFIGKKRGKA